MFDWEFIFMLWFVENLVCYNLFISDEVFEILFCELLIDMIGCV